MRRTSAVSTVDILGIAVSAVGMDRTIAHIGEWIQHREGGVVCAIDVYNLMLARSDDAHRRSLIQANMVTPDGTPLSWVGRLKGRRDMRRVCGPDLMIEVCRQSVSQGWTHYFYGGADGVAESLAKSMQKQCPGLVVAGFESPPFRPLTTQQRQEMIDRLRTAKPDIVWVGLGCPKQEAWMRDNIALLAPAVLIGVGAAFDFHTGRVKRAPMWMQNYGIEWLYRFASEPRRLWRRYLVYAPQFVLLSLADFFANWRYTSQARRTSVRKT